MKEEKEEIKYFAVVYCTKKYGYSIHLLPGKDKEDCLNNLRKMKENPKTRERMLATTVIKRNMVNFKDGFIFGCPKSLDVLRSK